MKNLRLLACCLTLLSCHHSYPGHHANDKALRISLQPIANFSPKQTTWIASQITNTIGKPVAISTPISMPNIALDTTKGPRYSADSLLDLFRPDPNSNKIAIILTDNDIFTTVKDEKGNIKKPESKYRVWGIFGLGDCPGDISIVSDYRLRTPDTAQFHHRLRTVVLHELGHNFGLPHCPTPHCIINDANEKISTIDNSQNDYCQSCRKKLGLL